MNYSLITVAKDPVNDPTELHTKAQRVLDIDASETQELIDDMLQVMKKERGVGLAAPQVAALKRVVTFDLTADGGQAAEPVVCINPVITKASHDLVMSEEGCLSIPGEFFPVVRASEVTMRYHDRDGQRQTMRATGLMAIAIQHEIDHLDGVLMTDRFAQQTSLRAQFEEIDSEATHRIG